MSEDNLPQADVGAQGSDTKVSGLDLLRQPFPPNLLSKLPKPTKRQAEEVRADFKKGIRCQECGQWHHPQVVHLDYVGHAALTDRLLDCDPLWNWEPVATDELGRPMMDEFGGMWIKLTVLNQTRLGYGHPDGKKGGDAIKEVIGDALRNAAMRFGAALDLWHKGDLHADEVHHGDQQDAPKIAAQSGPEDAERAAHAKAVERAVSAIKGMDSLGDLQSYWQDLAKREKRVAAEKSVIDAKDAKKAELAEADEKNRNADLGYDDIPF